jgi:hypothetical protein
MLMKFGTIYLTTNYLLKINNAEESLSATFLGIRILGESVIILILSIINSFVFINYKHFVCFPKIIC